MPDYAWKCRFCDYTSTIWKAFAAEWVIPMATFNANKSRIHFSKNAATSVVATFVEEKVSGSPKIYAQSQSLVQNTTPIS